MSRLCSMIGGGGYLRGRRLVTCGGCGGVFRVVNLGDGGGLLTMP